MVTKTVTILGKNYKLSGTFIIPNDISEKLPAVVFYHGMVSQSKPRYVQRAKKLAERGIIGLCFDFRGCGESDGKLGELSIADWLADGLLAFDYLTKLSLVDKNRIGIAGKSFGGYMGALVSKQRSIKSMVFQAPAVFPDAWFDKPYKLSEEIKRERLIYRMSSAGLNNKAITAMKQYNNPLLIIGSEHDTICPKKIVEGFYDNAGSQQKKLTWISDADHQLSKEQWNNEYTTMMTDWFTKTLN